LEPPSAAEPTTSRCWGIDAKPCAATVSASTWREGWGGDIEPAWAVLRANPVSVGPADVAISRLANAGSAASCWYSPYEVLCGRLGIIVDGMRAE